MRKERISPFQGHRDPYENVRLVTAYWDRRRVTGKPNPELVEEALNSMVSLKGWYVALRHAPVQVVKDEIRKWEASA